MTDSRDEYLGSAATASLEQRSTRPIRAYVELSAEAHYTAYNVFINNDLFHEGTGLSLEPLGLDLTGRVIVEWQGVRVGYQHMFRTEEFVGGDTHSVGSIIFSVDLPGPLFGR